MRFVVPATKRIELDGGDWIEVKKELTVGEQRRYRTAGFGRVGNVTTGKPEDQEVNVDWKGLSFARVEAYLVDWSAKKADGKDMPVSKAAIEALDPDDFEAIDAAIVTHIEAMAQEKKAQTGSPTPTSASS